MLNLVKFIFSLSVAELVIPAISIFSFVKYAFIGVLVYYFLLNKFKRTSAITIFLLLSFDMGYILIFGYSVTLHYILLQILIIGSVDYIFSIKNKELIHLNEFFYKTIVLFSILKIFVALNVIFDLNIVFLSYMFEEVSGGGIYKIFGLNVPRLTFGPEFIFLISYFIFNDKKYALLIVASIVLGFSRVYLLLLPAIFLFLKKKKLFFIYCIISLAILINSNLLDARDVMESDARFMQWEIFQGIMSRSPIFGSYNEYINVVESLLASDGYNYGKSECEACQIIGDIGFLPFLVIFFQLSFILRRNHINSRLIMYYYFSQCLILAAAFFNPAFTTFAYVAVSIVLISKLKLIHSTNSA